MLCPAGINVWKRLCSDVDNDIINVLIIMIKADEAIQYIMALDR